MTEPYDWIPMPHKVSIRCPACGAAAVFEFAKVVKLIRARDVEYFKKNDNFEYVKFTYRTGGRWHAAVFYHGLAGNTLSAIKNLPAGYKPEDWAHSQYHYRYFEDDVGAALCGACGYRRKHHLKWPKDAYFQVEHKGRVLWAFERESLIELEKYIASTDRDRHQFKWESFLLHVPSHFLQKSARKDVCKKLNRLIKAG